MSEKSLCVFFILAFLQTGSSDSSVHISQRHEGARLNVTCILTGRESLTQVAWEMVQDYNYTSLGVFHPNLGTHIPSEHVDKVQIKGSQSPHACSSVSLDMTASNISGSICCTVTTFPSGNLKQCAEITSANTEKPEAQLAGRELGLLGQLGVLIIVSILSLGFFILTGYFCYSCCCTRKQVFHVQQANLTAPLASTETNTEELHEDTTPGFDPAKLYTKIKVDLYYGRLWKSYQGRARVPTQGSPFAPRQIYYRLGERPLPQREEESTPTGTDSIAAPPTDSN
ncbi:immunoglobulin domain-containing protein [Astyanax mexicanus]|uniref:immunoglobulin domain-containing protein n=1 Tax=Astyanax mexicanus TaxID=7994 RepID=UPI0020CACAC9|nr:immunoglobulin domain-containing protein [Astyanax mexicanus]